MHYEQIKRGFAPIRDFDLKNGMRAFRFIERRDSKPQSNNLFALRQQNSAYTQARLGY